MKLKVGCNMSLDQPMICRCTSFQSWISQLPASLSSGDLTVDRLCMFNKLACQNNAAFIDGLQREFSTLLGKLKFTYLLLYLIFKLPHHNLHFKTNFQRLLRTFHPLSLICKLKNKLDLQVYFIGFRSGMKKKFPL